MNNLVISRLLMSSPTGYTVDAITVTLCYDYGTNVDFAPEQLANMSHADQDKVVFGSRVQLLAWYELQASAEHAFDEY
jgi:hypothetical protein